VDISPSKNNREKRFDSNSGRYVNINHNKHLSKRARCAHPLSISNSSFIASAEETSPPFLSSDSSSSLSSSSPPSSSFSNTSSFFSFLHSKLAPFFKDKKKNNNIIPTIPPEVIKTIKAEMKNGISEHQNGEEEWFKKEVLPNICDFIIGDESNSNGTGSEEDSLSYLNSESGNDDGEDELCDESSENEEEDEDEVNDDVNNEK
jgi:hypothetical protein